MFYLISDCEGTARSRQEAQNDLLVRLQGGGPRKTPLCLSGELRTYEHIQMYTLKSCVSSLFLLIASTSAPSIYTVLNGADQDKIIGVSKCDVSDYEFCILWPRLYCS